MKTGRWWLFANVATPTLAVLVILCAAALMGFAQNTAADREQGLANLVITPRSAETILLSAESLAALAQGEAEEVPLVSSGRPETVIASSVQPSECSALWLGVAVPTSTADRWAQTSIDGTIIGVSTRADTYANPATALAAFESLGELIGKCPTIFLRVVETSVERTEQLRVRSTVTSEGIPEYDVDRRTSFDLDGEVQGWNGVTRYYLAGTAIFEFSYWYDAATGPPPWASTEVASFERRIADLLPGEGRLPEDGV